MIEDKKSEAVFLTVAESPTDRLPFTLRFAEVLSPLFAECWRNPTTKEWNILPPIESRTHTRYTQSGSTSMSHFSGYEDYDQDDEETWTD